jgi:hypothetical protein
VAAEWQADVAALVSNVGKQLVGKGKAPVVQAAVLPGHDASRLAFSHRGGSMVSAHSFQPPPSNWLLT